MVVVVIHIIIHIINIIIIIIIIIMMIVIIIIIPTPRAVPPELRAGASGAADGRPPPSMHAEGPWVWYGMTYFMTYDVRCIMCNELRQQIRHVNEC